MGGVGVPGYLLGGGRLLNASNEIGITVSSA